MQQQRRRHLQRQFGPEYDRALSTHSDAHEAERELEHRAERVEQLHIRPLSSDEREHYLRLWKSTQAQFVDDPAGATHEADALVGEVMASRGYPVGDFEQRAADISVNHARVVEHYRAAHSIALRNSGGTADTEDLRQALVHYRALFEDLLEDTKSTESPRTAHMEARR
jgi:hypothetical protein